MKKLYLLLFSTLILTVLAVTLATSYGKAALQTPTTGSDKAQRGSDASQRPVTATIPEGLVTLHVAFGSRFEARKKVATSWDGRLGVSSGRVHGIRLWQDDPRNSVDGSEWTLTTQHAIPWNSQQRARGHKAMPLQDGAIVVELAGTGPDTELKFETAQGDFAVLLRDVPLGAKKGFKNGLIQISRMANSVIALSAPTEDDYPAAAVGPDGAIYVAYQAFTHGEGFRSRPPIAEPPKDFGYLADPVGGDQVFLMKLVDGAWSSPQPVTPPGEDVYRTAVAVDGSARVWVFWSANRDENWDIYARALDGDDWSKKIRLSTDAGPDSFPVATTDASGRVWAAWQAFRDGKANILAVRQDGAALGEPITVADEGGNLWAPAIAASTDGQVAVAFDGYTAGNYDVSVRIFSGESFGDVIRVANSLEAETRPSLTYDNSGRLWIAYEQSPEDWGKDTGPTDNVGTRLYTGRSVAVRVLAEGKLQQPVGNPADAFQPARGGGRGQKLAVPQITTDSSGRVWLAVRSNRLGTRVGVGTTWFEHLAWYQGDVWSKEILCARTDNILDNRPALVGTPGGEVVMIGSTDGRFATGSRLPQWFIAALRRDGRKVQNPKREVKWPDPVNNELMMASIGPVPGKPGKVQLEPVALAKVSGPTEAARREADDVARARAARTSVGGKTLQLVRGEFHRHTELSPDGGGDGLLMDMWRYGIDAADFDWIGNGDHDNGNGREYSWWIVQKTTSLFQIPGAFTPMYTYERSCGYPDGHRNVVFVQRGVRPLARLKDGKGKAMDNLPADTQRPNTPDTLMLYDYLRQFDGVCASHTSGTNMGTDWRDNDPKVEPIVEIFQGCRQSYEMPGAPRSNSADNSIGGWRPFGFVSLALKKGFRLGFQSSSDHGSTHISYCNVWVEEPTREAILASMKARHLYGATDNIVADVRCGEHFMGDEFTTKEKPRLSIRLGGTRPFTKVHVIKDGNYVHSASPNQRDVEFDWTDFDATAGATSYYYVRGEQEDGELVWVSPMWITYRP